MNLRLPVVTTAKGAEGIPIKPERDFELAESETQFAKKVTKLLDEESLRRKYGELGKIMIDTKYAESNAVKSLLDVLF